MNSLFSYQIQAVGVISQPSNKSKNTKNRNIMQIIKNLFTILLIGLVTVANANNNPIKAPTVNLTEAANGKIHMTLMNSESTTLKIQDADGVTIYKEAIRSQAIVEKNYDLTTLTDGTYVFSIELADKFIEQNVNIKAGNITLEDAIISAKPIFFEGDNSIFVTITDLTKANVEIRIIDASGNEIYQIEKQNINQFNTKYDLSKLENDDYTVVVTVNEKTYYKNIKLQ